MTHVSTDLAKAPRQGSLSFLGPQRAIRLGTFQFAVEHLKPIDAVIVGMYPRCRDQITENAALARHFGAGKGT